MRIAYADPPYPGCAHLYKDHPDYGGEVDHVALLEQLELYDGWILHTSSPGLAQVLALCPTEGIRICSWVKGFAAFRTNVPLAYAWEPVIVKPCRLQTVDRLGTRSVSGAIGGVIMRDWIQENITMKRGLTGAKPARVVEWALRCVGAEREDEIDDLFPGSGAVQHAIDAWRGQGALFP